MSRSKKLRALRLLAGHVEDLCQAHGADRYIDELQAVAERQERQHRAMGRRVCGARYAGSVRDAVAYFVCATVLGGELELKGWESVVAIRQDYVLGQVCRAIVLSNGQRARLTQLEEAWSVLDADYGRDIAGNA
jgi:hypothetical protein